MAGSGFVKVIVRPAMFLQSIVSPTAAVRIADGNVIAGATGFSTELFVVTKIVAASREQRHKKLSVIKRLKTKSAILGCDAPVGAPFNQDVFDTVKNRFFR
jgi:hypothetical protein